MRVRGKSIRGSGVLAVSLLAATLAVFAVASCAPLPARPNHSAAPPASPSLGKTCLGQISYPGLSVQQLNISLPVEGVSDEYIQYELAVANGGGACVGPPVVSVDRLCPVPTGAAEETIDHMLGSTPDAITTSEFAAGSVQALTETVTGKTAGGGAFQYRMTAWHYPRDAAGSNIVALVQACDGAIADTTSGVRRVAVFDGLEPYLVAYRLNNDVFLIESLANVAPDGTVARINDTSSGLLSAGAITVIQKWWTTHAIDYFRLADEETRAA